MIKTVTFTGADDTVTPEHLRTVSKLFPFVEWGILISASQQGVPRFPSMQWIKNLREVNVSHDMKLSLHICGRFVREFMKYGSTAFLSYMEESWSMFNRVQLNFHGQPHETNTDSLLIIHSFIKACPQKEFIFQVDGRNGGFIGWMDNIGKLPNVTGLFDVSHGAGILPDSWPTALDRKCGYAGGLGPNNLQDQLTKIIQAAISGKHVPEEIWVDMETKVRTGDSIHPDDMFDMDKVYECIKIAEPFVKYVKPVEENAAHGFSEGATFPEFPQDQPANIR